MSTTLHAIRSLRRSSGYSTAVVAIVALGMALATTVFALVDGILFKPLAFRSAGELYAAGIATDGEPGTPVVSPRELLLWRTALPGAVTAIHESVGLGTLGVINGPLVWSRAVDADFWNVLGAQPLVGGFVSTDYTPNRFAGPAIISHGLWQRVFAGAADVVGKSIPVDRFQLRVVGVMPRDFVFPAGRGNPNPDIILPTALAPESFQEARRYLDVVVRIPSSVGTPAAWARLGEGIHNGRVELTSLESAMTGRERPAALLLFGAMSVIVLLVALNVGSLFASRNLERVRELAARRALGATAAHLAWLQVVEAGLLVGAGALLGALAARPMLAFTVRLLPADVLLLREPVIDTRVALLVALVAAAVALIVAAGGIRVAMRSSLTALIGSGAGSTSRRERTRGRFLLLATEVAIALVLVLGGTLFAASMREVWSTEPGFAVEDTYFFDVRPGGNPGRDRDVVRVLAIAQALRGVPGIERAAAIDTILLGVARRGSLFRRPPGALGPGEPEFIPISSGFFELAGVTPLTGRLPSDEEVDAGAPVAVVSQQAAATFWPAQQPLGKILETRTSRASVTVVGVVRDARYQRLDRESDGEIFAPIAAGLRPSSAPTFLIRSRARKETVLAGAIEAIRRADPGAQIRRAESMNAALGQSVQRRRFHAWIFGAFSVAGLTLAGLGVLGLLAASTRRRTQEIGIRMALGASSARVLRLIVSEQLAAVAVGLAAGALVSAWTVRYLQALLYEVQPFDPRLWLLSAAVVLIMAALGAVAPALSASRVEPVKALRAE